MRSDIPLPGLDALKRQARRLRDGLEADGDFISHSESLELIAKQYGFRNWNTLHAACGNRPAPLALGAQVTGRYLGQPFTARVIGMEARGQGRMRLSLDLDEPVDVVTFESFSAFRRRITGVINENGETSERTSNGEPHLVIMR